MYRDVWDVGPCGATHLLQLSWKEQFACSFSMYSVGKGVRVVVHCDNEAAVTVLLGPGTPDYALAEDIVVVL